MNSRRHPTKPGRLDPQPLGRALLANVVPAYIGPAAMSGLSALTRGDDELLTASYTTIAIPSAAAALVTTLWVRRAKVRRARASRSTIGSALRSSFACGAIAMIGTSVAAANGAADELFFNIVPSAALGAGIVAVTTARRARGSVSAGPTSGRCVEANSLAGASK